MKKLKTFFYVFKGSISSPKYYNEVINTKLGFSIRYIIFLMAIVSLLFTAIVSVKLVPDGARFIYSLSNQAKELYPSDLTINFKDGSWSINKEEPYVIPMPKADSTDKQVSTLENLVVFYKKGTIEDLNNYKTLMLLNDKNIIYRDSQGKITAQPIEKIKDLYIDKSNVNGLIDKVYKYAKYAPYVSPIFIFSSVLLFGYMLPGIFQVIAAGFIIYLLSLIKGSKLNFKQSCQMTIHTMTIPLILQFMVGYTSYRNIGGSWFFVLNILIAALFMIKMGKDRDLIKIEKVD